jgi:hypothetical protein
LAKPNLKSGKKTRCPTKKNRPNFFFFRRLAGEKFDHFGEKRKFVTFRCVFFLAKSTKKKIRKIYTMVISMYSFQIRPNRRKERTVYLFLFALSLKKKLLCIILLAEPSPNIHTCSPFSNDDEKKERKSISSLSSYAPTKIRNFYFVVEKKKKERKKRPSKKIFEVRPIFSILALRPEEKKNFFVADPSKRKIIFNLPKKKNYFQLFTNSQIPGLRKCQKTGIVRKKSD